MNKLLLMLLQLLLQLLLLCDGIAQAQVAHRVLSIDHCAPFLELDDVDGLRIGDRILLYQNQQTDTNTTPAGSWESLVIEEIVGTLVFTDRSPQIPFHVASGVQAVRVDTASNMTIDQPLRTRPFRDGIGGVRMLCADTVVLQAAVRADGCGFRGGRRSISGWDTSWIADTAEFLSGAAGEVGSSSILTHEDQAGRRPWYTGGGGGNARNAGGGGGANGGAGGSGGWQTSAYESLALGGRGGRTRTARLPVMGGGGGGGHQNDFMGSDGGNGGGVIILRCSVLIVSDQGALSARGVDAALALNDGAGGGGAGGSVMLGVDTIIGSLLIDVSGGNGGETLGEWYCYGPGGGGGGGVIFASERIQPAIEQILDGGEPGSSYGVGPCESDMAYGATKGVAGRFVTPGVVGTSDTLCAPPDIIVRGLDAAGGPGERVAIPFEIEVLSTLTSSLRLTLWVRCRASVLVPEGAYRWAGRRAAVRFLNVYLPAGPPRVVTDVLSYTCALGDSARVGIGIDSAFVDDNETTVRVDRHGMFTVDGVCQQGERARLFDPWEAIPGRQVYDVHGRRLPDEIQPEYRLSVPGSRGTVLIVPR